MNDFAPGLKVNALALTLSLLFGFSSSFSSPLSSSDFLSSASFGLFSCDVCSFSGSTFFSSEDTLSVEISGGVADSVLGSSAEEGVAAAPSFFVAAAAA